MTAPRGHAGCVLSIDRTWDGGRLPRDDIATVELQLDGDDLVLRVDAPFRDDPPPPGPPGPTPGLWEHEVVEIFVAGPGADDAVPYLEIEMSPRGHYLALRLEGVRRVVDQGLPLDLRTTVDGDRWRATARAPRELLPPPPWRAAAFAMHGAGPGRRHHTSVPLPLPGSRPDFHQPGRFPPLRLDGGRRPG